MRRAGKMLMRRVKNFESEENLSASSKIYLKIKQKSRLTGDGTGSFCINKEFIC